MVVEMKGLDVEVQTQSFGVLAGEHAYTQG
jgi:hypothetical protein